MIKQTLFDRLPGGRNVYLYTIQNTSGASASFLNIGAAIHSVVVPDRKGTMQNVALGYSDAEHYLHTVTYAGAVCGRVANRIASAEFDLNGRIYQLRANDGKNQLHGGPGGFHQKLWDAEICNNSLHFRLESPDGDENYPGKLQIQVTYAFDEDNTLSISYEAVSNADTLCALTNHAYWNLAGYGSGDPLGQTIQILADFYTPIDADVLPTGQIAPVSGPLDLRKPTRIISGKESGDPQIALVYGYDHNFVLRNYCPEKLLPAACLRDPQSGRQMWVSTTMPGIQFFSGSQQPDGHTGVALETQFFPNAMSYWWFPSIVLRKGKVQRSRTEYHFGIMTE